MRASSLLAVCLRKCALTTISSSSMTRSIPLRQLKVHPPAVNGDLPAARGQTAKSLARPNFADLLRASVRPPYRRPAVGLANDNVALMSAQPLIQGAQVVTDVTEEHHNTLLLPVIDTATESVLGRGTHRFDDLQTPAKQSSSKSVVASEVEAAQADPRGHGIISYVTATISNFCNDPEVQANDGWTVRLSLNETILPSTTLHLSLSRQWLLLRFECGDAQSRQVIAQHRDTLQTALEEAIAPRREVSIDLD